MNLNGLYGSYYNFLLNGVSSKYLKNSYKPDGTLDWKSVYGSYAKESVNYGAMRTLTGVKADANALQSALARLSAGQGSAKRAAVSSDAEKLVVSGGFSLRAGSDIQIEVHKLASGQKNKGASLSSFQEVGEGTYEFEAQIGEKAFAFQVKAQKGDTVLDFQRKMAQTINDRSIGLFASVKRAGEVSSLNIMANATGYTRKAAFSLRDTYGNAVEATGAQNIYAQPQKAEYSVNGIHYTADSNEVTLKNGLRATLKDTTEQPVTVAMETDAQTVMDAVSDMVKHYNRLMDAAKQSESKKMTGELAMVSRNYRNVLSRIGVSLDETDRMELYKEALAEAVQSGEAQDALADFSNANAGFTARLSRAAGKIFASPASYMGSMFRVGMMNTGFSGVGLFFNMQI